MKHLIFDLETLGTTSNCVVLSIACLPFNFLDKEVDKTKGIQLKLSVKDQIKNYRRDIQQSTVEWWKNQPDEAKEILKETPNDLTVVEACLELNRYIKSIEEYSYKQSYVFSRGHYFDFPLLDSLYSNAKMLPTFNGWRVRDVRTLLETLELFANSAELEYSFNDIGKNNHSAIDDCVADVKRITRMFGLF